MMGTDKEFTVTQSNQLLPFLLDNLAGKGRNKVKALLTHRQVAVDGKIVTRHDCALHPGQKVTVLAARGLEKEAMQGIRILHEDDSLIVIDKPPGLLSMATDAEREKTAYHALMTYVRHTNPQSRIFIVHRLDKETSGIMMFAKTEAIQQALQNDWRDVVLERAYVVAVEGRVEPEKGKITSWLQQSKTQTMYVGKPGQGQKAILNYKVLASGNDYSLLDVRLETGRKNQIRVQMQSLGHSVVGDKRYGAKSNPLGRLGLHARVLAFRHPKTGETLRFETPVPPKFRRLVADPTGR
jgi:23S rRNA pseudouridine1911/1915/1917 synthase